MVKKNTNYQLNNTDSIQGNLKEKKTQLTNGDYEIRKYVKI